MIATTVAVGSAHLNAEILLRSSLCAHAPLLQYLPRLLCGTFTRREALKLKPKAILDRLIGNQEDVLFLDADCILRGPIAAIEQAQESSCEIAAYECRPGLWADGVLFVRNTRDNKRLMSDWSLALERDGWEGTDQVLSDLMIERDVRVNNLPPSCCWREKWGMREKFGNVPITIEVTEVEP